MVKGQKKNLIENIKKTLRDHLGASSISLPAALASFSTVAVALLVLGQLHNIYVWPLGILAFITTYFAVVKSVKNLGRPGSPKEQYLIDLLVILGIIIWFLINANFAAQNIFIGRDPAILVK